MKQQQRAEKNVRFTILCYSHDVFVVLLMSECPTESVVFHQCTGWNHLVNFLTVTSGVHNVHAAGMGAVDEKKTSIHIDQKQLQCSNIKRRKLLSELEIERIVTQVLSEEVRQAGSWMEKNYNKMSTNEASQSPMK